MNRSPLLILATLLTVIPSASWAGEVTEGIFKSSLGYSVKIPRNWVRLDAATAGALSKNLPKNIAHRSLNRFDVVFFPNFAKGIDLSLDADRERGPKDTPAIEEYESADAPSFSPTISIMVIKAEISDFKDQAVQKAYSDELAKSVQKSAAVSDFKIESTTIEPFTPSDALFYKYSYNAKGKDIMAQQAIFPHNDNTIIVTCSDEKSETESNTSRCRTLVNSFKF